MEYELKTEFIELFKLLQLMGVYGSGGEAKHQIAAGVVRVDGQVELRKKCKMRKGQQVQAEGQTIRII